MTFFDSRVSIFQITDTGTTLRDISAYITDIGGVPGPRNLNEVTALGDTGAKHIAGLEDVTITLSGIFDDTATTGPDAVLGPLRTDDTARAWDYGPKGKTSGFLKYSGTMKMDGYELGTRVGNRVEWSASLKVQGVVTRGTY
jgi:hypothetical protein